MAEDSDTGCSFTVEEMRRDDPRLRQFLEIPEEAKQSSFHATIQLENVMLWDQFHLTADDFNHLRSLALKGKLRVITFGVAKSYQL